jgi:hypothetical protein
LGWGTKHSGTRPLRVGRWLWNPCSS